MGFRITVGTIRPEAISVLFNGRAIEAYPGETLAAALIANGIRGFRRDLHDRLRGPYCNMGTCFECVVEIRETGALPHSASAPAAQGAWRTVRACLTSVHAGLEARSREDCGLAERSA